MAEPRIVSLIPSATEIVASLGLERYLVGRSHECDYPAAVQALPVCTEPKFDPVGSSRVIHDRVSELLQSALAVYRVKTEVLAELRPTHILTQAQCEVCAVSLGEVEQAVAQLTHGQPQVISLQPVQLQDLWSDLERVAVALAGEEGKALADATCQPLRQRLRALQAQTQPLPRVRTVCIEWPEPLMTAGNWVPELVALAGGEALLAEAGHHSPWTDWERIVAADPDCLVLMPCGYDLPTTVRECRVLTEQPGWGELRAVRQGRVCAVDGNQYFNRPGPRLVDSAEILGEIFHPQAAAYGYEGKGWMQCFQPVR